MIHTDWFSTSVFWDRGIPTVVPDHLYFLVYTAHEVDIYHKPYS